MDSEYLRWLEINHPDSVPADRRMLVLAPEPSGGVSEDNPTLTDLFSYVQPSSPLTVTECATSSNYTFLNSHASTVESAKTPPTLESTPHASTTGQLKLLPYLSPPLMQSAKTPPTLESTPHASTTETAKTPPSPESTSHAESAKTPPTLDSTPHASTTESAKTCPTPMTTTPHTSAVGLAKTSPNLSSSVHIKTPVTTPSSTPSSSGRSSSESDPELRYISKYLVQVISTTPKRSTSAAKRVSGARVLTSAKCAAILEEREQKKKETEEQAKSG